MSKVFRKVSLARLSSPEQLDQLITVAGSGAWLALLAVGVLLASVMAWAVYGRIPTTVSGGGILIKTGGIVNVVAPVDGQIEALYVSEGDLVKKGQIIARIAQPRLLDEIRAARAALTDLEERERQMTGMGAENVRFDVLAIEKEQAGLVQEIQITEKRLNWLEERRKLQAGLLDEGLITRQTLVDTENEISKAGLTIEQKRGAIKKLEARAQRLSAERDQERLRGQRDISEARRALDLKKAELEYSSRILSSHTGIVVELRAPQGQVIRPGNPVLSLELSGEDIQDLQALIYMPSGKGKQIEPGMLMRISPQTVKREEHGYMQGIVTHVAEFPSSKQGMMRHLENEGLVDQFFQAGAPIAVFADPIPDPELASGYRWSTPQGPPDRVYSGTLCSGSVEVENQAPISLVFPFLKKQAGLN